MEIRRLIVFVERFWMVVVVAFLLAAGSACATSFYGSPHVEGGAKACQAKCQNQGLEMAGMVFMGEYTDGCICAVPGKVEEAQNGAAEAAGGTVGVEMQNRRERQRQNSMP